MQTDYSDIFTILKSSLFNSNQDYLCISHDSNWEYIYEEMQAQTISTLCYHWLKLQILPDSYLQQKWMLSCLQQQARWLQVMYAQTQLIDLMEHNNISCVIIKGAAAMMSYPHPSLRAVGDIDFLVKRTDYNKAATILEDNGYNLVSDKNPKAKHYEYEKDGVIIELHNRLGSLNDTDENLISLFETGIDNRVWHTINNIEFPTLPDDLNGLVLVIHIRQHLKGGLGLRHIIDWMMYVNKNNSFNNLLPLLKLTNTELLAKTITIICQKYLGLPKIIDESNDYPYDELLNYIISKGNFGAKTTNSEDKISYVSLITMNPVQLISRLQVGGLQQWEATQNHRLLRPFAWIYQIGFILKELIRNRITPTKFIKSHKIGLKQRELIDKLLNPSE